MRQRGKITDEEMKRIAKLRSQGMSYNDIGRRMGRGAETIRVHYNRYYGIAIVKSVWIDDDLDKLRRMVAVRSPMEKMCAALGRSRHAVKRKITELGLGRRQTRSEAADEKISNSIYAAAANGSRKLLAAYVDYFAKYHPDCEVVRRLAA